MYQLIYQSQVQLFLYITVKLNLKVETIFQPTIFYSTLIWQINSVVDIYFSRSCFGQQILSVKLLSATIFIG